MTNIFDNIYNDSDDNIYSSNTLGIITEEYIKEDIQKLLINIYKEFVISANIVYNINNILFDLSLYNKIDTIIKFITKLFHTNRNIINDVIIDYNDDNITVALGIDNIFIFKNNTVIIEKNTFLTSIDSGNKYTFFNIEQYIKLTKILNNEYDIIIRCYSINAQHILHLHLTSLIKNIDISFKLPKFLSVTDKLYEYDLLEIIFDHDIDDINIHSDTFINILNILKKNTSCNINLFITQKVLKKYESLYKLFLKWSKENNNIIYTDKTLSIFLRYQLCYYIQYWCKAMLLDELFLLKYKTPYYGAIKTDDDGEYLYYPNITIPTLNSVNRQANYNIKIYNYGKIEIIDKSLTEYIHYIK